MWVDYRGALSTVYNVQFLEYTSYFVSTHTRLVCNYINSLFCSAAFGSPFIPVSPAVGDPPYNHPFPTPPFTSSIESGAFMVPHGGDINYMTSPNTLTPPLSEGHESWTTCGQSGLPYMMSMAAPGLFKAEKPVA